MHRTPGAREIAMAIAIIAGLQMPADVSVSRGGSAPYAGLESLLEEARRAQKDDLASWARYRFKRQAVRAKLDSSGRVSSRTDLESVVTPLAEARTERGAPRFDETLVRMDGVPPTAAQVEDHRDDAPFTRHYATTVASEGAEEEAGYSLSFLLEMSSYRHDGMEQVEGRRCHRIRFEADPNVPEDHLSSRFARALAGTLWITEDGAHLARASVHSVKAIDITFGIVRLSELQIEMMSQALEGGSWVPRSIETRSTVRILGVPMRRLNRYSYSEFVPVPAAAPAETAGR